VLVLKEPAPEVVWANNDSPLPAQYPIGEMYDHAAKFVWHVWDFSSTIFTEDQRSIG
jgi:hypothetical protein